MPANCASLEYSSLDSIELQIKSLLKTALLILLENLQVYTIVKNTTGIDLAFTQSNIFNLFKPLSHLDTYGARMFSFISDVFQG